MSEAKRQHQVHSPALSEQPAGAQPGEGVHVTGAGASPAGCSVGAGKKLTRQERASWHRNEAAQSAECAAEKCEAAGQRGNARLMRKIARCHKIVAEQIERGQS